MRPGRRTLRPNIIHLGIDRLSPAVPAAHLEKKIHEEELEREGLEDGGTGKSRLRSHPSKGKHGCLDLSAISQGTEDPRRRENDGPPTCKASCVYLTSEGTVKGLWERDR